MSGDRERPPAIGGRICAVVVRHADDPRLESCLAALKAQRGVALHVVVIENGSGRQANAPGESWKTDGGAVRRLEIVTRAANPGFAAAFNEGWARTDDDLVLSVNPDCRLDPDAVATASATLSADPGAAAVALRLHRPGGDLLDSAGIVLHPLWLRASDRGGGRAAAGAFSQPADVDAACLAGALLHRSRVDRARDGAGEILDSRYFAYQEDVDLGWRIRRAGWRIRYEPRATGAHDRGWKEGGRREIPLLLRRLSLRNRWFTILKNIGWAGLIVRLPFLCVLECAMISWLLVSEPAVLRAYAAVVAGIPGTLARRPLLPRAG